MKHFFSTRGPPSQFPFESSCFFSIRTQGFFYTWFKQEVNCFQISLQILALLLRRKKHLLNTHILHLTFALVGTVDSDRESSVIPNRVAFKDLLCDLEVINKRYGILQQSGTHLWTYLRSRHSLQYEGCKSLSMLS